MLSAHVGALYFDFCLVYVLYMFGVCMMSLSHSLPCVHVRPSVHIYHTPMLGLCMIVVCIWWVVSLWMWNVSLGWIYASFLLSFCVFLVMFVVKRLARSEIRGCCRCIDVRYACAWPEVKMPYYCLHVSEVFLNVSFKMFLTVMFWTKSNQIQLWRGTHMTIRWVGWRSARWGAWWNQILMDMVQPSCAWAFSFWLFVFCVCLVLIIVVCAQATSWWETTEHALWN